jgi:hypothetical protein
LCSFVPAFLPGIVPSGERLNETRGSDAHRRRQSGRRVNLNRDPAGQEEVNNGRRDGGRKREEEGEADADGGCGDGGLRTTPKPSLDEIWPHRRVVRGLLLTKEEATKITTTLSVNQSEVTVL